MHCIGATYGGESVISEFIKYKGAFIGYNEDEYQPLFSHLREIKIGELVVIKAYSPSNGLYLKAIGLCISEEILNIPNLGKGRQIHWLWQGNVSLGIIRDGYTNMRTGTIYIERNIDVLKKVMALISTVVPQLMQTST